MASKTELKRFRSNLSDELDSAALYETLAGAERDTERKRVYAELAASERDHARVWSEKLRANGVNVRLHRASAKTQMMRALVRVFGPDDSAGIVSFAVEGVHAHDVGTILDESRVAIRAGHHCAQPLMAHLGVDATARASFGVYNGRGDVEALVRGIERVRRIFG